MTCVPVGHEQGSCAFILESEINIFVPSSSSALFVRSSTCDTAAMEANACLNLE